LRPIPRRLDVAATITVIGGIPDVDDIWFGAEFLIVAWHSETDCHTSKLGHLPLVCC